jgi:hypothetical protein
MVTTYYMLEEGFSGIDCCILFDISRKHSAELHRIYILAVCSCPLSLRHITFLLLPDSLGTYGEIEQRSLS